MSALTPEQRSEILLTNIDKADCGVIAFQAITGLCREAAEVKMEARGYSKTEGTPRGTVEAALKAEGYKIEARPLFDGGGRETAATFALTHEYGTFLIYTERHVMALVDGDLHNSRGHWSREVELAEEVIPKKRR